MGKPISLFTVIFAIVLIVWVLTTNAKNKHQKHRSLPLYRVTFLTGTDGIIVDAVRITGNQHKSITVVFECDNPKRYEIRGAVFVHFWRRVISSLGYRYKIDRVKLEDFRDNVK